MPEAVVVHDHGVLHPGLRVAGQHDLAPRGVEPRGIVGFEHLDPPVLGVVGGAADVQPPGALGGAHEGGPLKGLGVDLLAAQRVDRLEALAVEGARDDDGVAASLADRPAEAVGEVDHTVAEHGARRARPAVSYTHL